MTEEPMQFLGWFHAVASQKLQMLKCFYCNSAFPGDVTWPQQRLWNIRYLVSWLSKGSEIGRCLFAILQLVYLAPHRCQPPLCFLCCFFWGGCFYFYLEPSQVLRSDSGVLVLTGCSLCWWQECHSSVITACQPWEKGADRHLPWARPEHPEVAQHSCCTSVGWTEYICGV